MPTPHRRDAEKFLETSMVVLIVESDVQEMRALADVVARGGHVPVTAVTPASAQKFLGREAREQPGLVLVNLNGRPAEVEDLVAAGRSRALPFPVVVMSRRASMEDAVHMMKCGAHDFWIKPVAPQRLEKLLEILEPRADSSGKGRGEDLPRWTILTQSAAMIRLKTMARQVAPSSASVFVQGESGTGKELFARYIHHHSDRAEKPFLAVNCAALPENLLESELFGYEKGAFTGAIRSKEGKFELANGGTLLLDEVTEIPVHLQAKLLRVLQEGEVDKVGGRYPVSVDVRVVATTNLSIEDALAEGRFRKDLYYRLNVIPLRIPPLRDRKEDIDLLARHFIEKYARRHRRDVKGITDDAMEKLKTHRWPGNVRELENVVQRAVLLTMGCDLTVESLFFDDEPVTALLHVPGESGEPDLMPLSEMEKRLIYKALAASNDNRTRAAEMLGISVRTLRNKLNEYRQGGLAAEGIPSC